MITTEVLDLLQYVQLGDGRTIGAADVTMWDKVIPKHIDLPTAMEAVEMHRRESTDWLQPAHIIANVKRINLARRREEARQHALDPARNQPSVVPWWFKKLRDAEIRNYAEVRKENPLYGRRIINPRNDGGDPVVPRYEGDELTLEQKLLKYSIMQEPGDEYASAVAALEHVPAAPVPKLGSFLRDPEA